MELLSELGIYFPPQICELLRGRLSQESAEIRFTLNKPVLVSGAGGVRILKDTNQNAVIFSEDMLKYTVSALSGGSLYSVNDTMTKGYITVEGGHRVGVCGTAVCERGEIKHIKSISSLCFRICREIKGAAEQIAGMAFKNACVCNLLIASPPGCGKTTVLRDLCRIIAGGDFGEIKRVGIADERREIASSRINGQRFDTGIASFVCDSYPKADAMNIMLRCMSPDVIVCDEIGGDDDFTAVRNCIRSGVNVIASAHAKDVYDLKVRFGSDISCFDKIIFLRGRGRVDKMYGRENGDY